MKSLLKKIQQSIFLRKKNSIVLKYFKFIEDAEPPYKGICGDAGWDLFSVEDKEILPNTTATIKTGIALIVPEHFYAKLSEKSGLAQKYISVHGGIIDSTYRGEVGVIIHNRDTKNAYRVAKGQKICQVIVTPCETATETQEVFELDQTQRNDGGFGHTGLTK